MATTSDNALAKLEDLRKTIINPTPEDVEALRDFEVSIKKHAMYRGWSELEVSKMVYQQLVNKVVELSNRLSEDRTLSTEAREGIFEARDVLRYFLSLFKTGKDDVVLEQIEADISKAESDWKTYRGS